MERQFLSPYVRQIVALIEQHPAGDLSVRQLARAVGRHEAFVARLFRQETGITIREYKTRTRMQRAVASIRNGDKVEAVALEVGYRSKKNFYRQFMRHFGTTPA